MKEAPGARAGRVLVLCDPCDIAALWAARELAARGATVDIITGPVLDSALRWEHRVGNGRASVAIDLFDGRRVTSETSAGVLNRLSYVSTERLQHVMTVEDAAYASQEMYALFLSWLHALPGPVVNRPSPQGLGGRWRHPSEWAGLAVQAGLRIKRYTLGSADRGGNPLQSPRSGSVVTVFVIGERLVGPVVPADVAAGCRRLASIAGETLLGVELAAPPVGSWEVMGATAMPYLPLGGQPLVDALLETLAP